MSDDEPGVLPRRWRWVRAVVLVLMVLGAVERVVLLFAHVNPLESDEAIVALMANHLRHGEFHRMYWGQNYGGPVEAIPAALLFLLTGPSARVAQLVGVLFAAGSSMLVWRIGRRTVGEPAARLAGALFWVWPPFFLVYSAKISIYFGSLFFALLTVLLVVRLRDGDAPWRWWPAALGLSAGVAWWGSPQTLFLLVPAGAAFAPALVRGWRKVLAAVPFAVVGAGPWLWWNADHGWESLKSPAGLYPQGYWERVGGFFRVLPKMLGFQFPPTDRWLWPVVTRPAVWLAVAMVVGVLVARPRRWGALAVIAALYPLMYAVPRTSVVVFGGHPRYVLTLVPVVALLVARVAVLGAERVGRRAVAPVVVGLLAVVGVAGVREDFRRPLFAIPGAPDAITPWHFDDLRALLRENGVAYAYADYWVAFRATFETGEKTIVVPIQDGLVRHEPYALEAGASENPAYIALTASKVLPLIEARLQHDGFAYTVKRRGEFALVLPATKVDHSVLVPAYWLQG